VQRSLDEGARALSQLSFPTNLPWRDLRTRLLQVLGVLAIIAGLCLANWNAVRTIALRLLHPDRDIPPWSSLVFEVIPAEPKVIYGSDTDLEVKITGGAVTEGVVLLTRSTSDAPPTQTGAFAMGNGRFGQKLQRVVQPMRMVGERAIQVAIALPDRRRAVHVKRRAEFLRQSHRRHVVAHQRSVTLSKPLRLTRCTRSLRAGH
jgi:hypothetical protein